MQAVAEVQDTPSTLFHAEPAGLGVFWILQDGLAAGEPAAGPARVAAPAAPVVPASPGTYPMARVTAATIAITAKRRTPARPPPRDSVLEDTRPPPAVCTDRRPGAAARLGGF